jgi:hypothetical protein
LFSGHLSHANIEHSTVQHSKIPSPQVHANFARTTGNSHVQEYIMQFSLPRYDSSPC